MESRNGSFATGAVSGSPELARSAAVNQADAGGMLPGQNGKSSETYTGQQPFISNALKSGY